MFQSNYSEEREALIGQAVTGLISDLRLIDVEHLISFITLEMYNNVADHVASSAERFFTPGFPAAWSADFLAAVCGEPQGSPAPVSGLQTRTPFATLFAVPGGDSTQRELSMENRSAVGGTEPRCCSLVRIGGVVPCSGRRAP